MAVPIPVLADPPPWAPAHGHRKHKDHHEPPVVVYAPPVHVYPPPSPVYGLPPPVYSPPPSLTITVPLR